MSRHTLASKTKSPEKIRLPLPSEADVISAYETVDAQVKESKLFRPPLSSEIAEKLTEMGFQCFTGTRARTLINRINREIPNEDLQLKVCHAPGFLSDELLIHSHAIAKKLHKRNPTPGEHAAVIGDIVGFEVAAKSVRTRVLAYNRNCDGEENSLIHSPTIFKRGYYPEDVLRVYKKYCKEHKYDSQPHLRRPRHADLVALIKKEIKNSQVSVVNMPVVVNHLRDHGHKILLRGGPGKVTRAMVREALIMEKVRCSEEGGRCTTGAVTRRLRALYDGLQISTDAVAIHLEGIVKNAKGAQRKILQYDKKPEKIELTKVCSAYLKCAAAVQSIVPFPPVAALKSELGCHETAVRQHLRVINIERAKQNQWPFIPAGNRAALDMKLLVAGEMSMENDRRHADAERISQINGRSAHYSFRVWDDLVKRAAKDKICLLPAPTTAETALRYRIGLLWALCRASIADEQRAHAKQSAHSQVSSVHNILGLREKDATVVAACNALSMAEAIGRLEQPSLTSRLKQMAYSSPSVEQFKKALDRTVKSMIDCCGLVLIPANRENAIIERLQQSLKGNKKTFSEVLPALPFERCDIFRIAARRTWRAADAQRLQILEAVSQECTNTGLSLENAAARLLYDPRQVKEWQRTKKLIEGHERARVTQESLSTSQEFLANKSKTEQRRLVAQVGEKLKAGNELAETLAELGIPRLAYQSMIYFRRCLETSFNERLTVLDSIQNHTKKRGLSLLQALTLEQVTEGIYQKWQREKRRYVSSVNSSDHERTLRYFYKSHSVEKRKQVMQSIGADLDEGTPLKSALACRWIPRHVYEVFRQTYLDSLSAAEKLAKLEAVERGGRVTARKLEMCQMTRESYDAWSATRKELEKAKNIPPFGTMEWSMGYIKALRKAQGGNHDVAKTVRGYINGASIDKATGAIAQYLDAALVLRKGQSTTLAARLTTISSRNELTIVDALFGCSPHAHADHRQQVAELRKYLEIGQHTAGDKF